MTPKATWHKSTKRPSTERRGALWTKPGEPSITLIVRGQKAVVSKGLRYAFEVSGPQGLSARSLWVYLTEAEAMQDGEAMGRAILEILTRDP